MTDVEKHERMSCEPRFQITTRLLSPVETIARLQAQISGASMAVAWIPGMQKERRGHAMRIRPRRSKGTR